MKNLLNQDFIPMLFASLLYAVLLVAAYFFKSVALNIISTVILFFVIPYYFVKLLDRGILSFDFIKVSFYSVLYLIIIGISYLSIYSVFLDFKNISAIDVFNPELVAKMFSENPIMSCLLLLMLLLSSVYFIVVFLNALYNKVFLEFKFIESLAIAVKFTFKNYIKFASVISGILILISLVDYLLLQTLDNIYIYIFLTNFIQLFSLSLIFVFLFSVNRKLDIKKPL